MQVGRARSGVQGDLCVTFDTWPELLGVGRGPRKRVVRWMRHCKGKGETPAHKDRGWLDHAEGVADVAWSQMGRVITFIPLTTILT